jgi:predicted nuclease of restriction endonuclease-like (RecB) superfamily
VTALREQVLQQLTKMRGLPNIALVIQNITSCGLGCGLRDFPRIEGVRKDLKAFPSFFILQRTHKGSQRYAIEAQEKGAAVDGNLIPVNYDRFLEDLKNRIRASQVRAALSVNRELIVLYWSIGHDILIRQRNEGWGAKIIDRLSEDLTKAFPDMRGFRARNLKYMRAFAEAYPDREFVQQVVALLPWGHQVRLLDMVKDADQREWYIRQAVQSGWSRNVLVHQIESRLFDRQGHALTNFDRTLPAPQSELAQQLMKDPYNFDFLTLGPEMQERDLEQSLLEHIRDFILELGKGFAFVGSQYRLAVGEQEFFLDLLFYHLRLRCFIVIDLKIEEFKPEFAGKMNFYLSAVDDLLRQHGDHPSLGLILCKEHNKLVVEYALRDLSKPMGVAQYRLTQALPEQLQSELPTPEDLAAELPLLDLLTLRIQLEQKLAMLARARGLDSDRESIAMLASDLHSGDYISTELMHNILILSDSLNRAVHGEKITSQRAKQSLETGSLILQKLDEQDTESGSGTSTI